MKSIMEEERFNIISEEDKTFITAFDEEINRLGYDFGGNIGSGFCWSKYMIIYSKTGVKNKKVIARVYIREGSIVLQLYLNKIDAHRDYLEKAPDFIKNVFIGTHGNCHHCRNDNDGLCKFRKTYSLDNRLIEKCNGVTFEFSEPNLEKLPDYMNLLPSFIQKENSYPPILGSCVVEL